MWVEKKIRLTCCFMLYGFVIGQIFADFWTGNGIFYSIGVDFCYFSSWDSICSRYRFGKFLLELYFSSWVLCLIMESYLYKKIKILKKPIMYRTFLGLIPLNAATIFIMYVKFNLKKHSAEDVVFLLVPLCFAVVWQFRETLRGDNWVQPSPPQSKESA